MRATTGTRPRTTESPISVMLALDWVLNLKFVQVSSTKPADASTQADSTIQPRRIHSSGRSIRPMAKG